ncbi:MAG: glycolate oxidase subunit GlcE [Rhodospirillaceae bacterium]|nr:glycolate oxidase subunit GlcE [Rhodospirillaceae bacterium]MBT4590271.1 glycolate oxidase subunit GlcE [Rhodospirillaceae bacterium]MBT7265941.1 glycolate oxidase subunit GlcE [Rhodospirillaceae bacterium]
MSEHFKPQSSDDVRDIIRAAQEDKQTLEIIGAGSKRGWGRPIGAAGVMDLSGLSGISLYEPEELVLSAAAGTSMTDIHQALAEHHQQLAFEPPDFSPLFGGEAGLGTLGGVIAANLSGPRRLQAGAARDHFLGFAAISGRGEEFKSGGRVVKNVTGFDLSKLLAGSFGTLAAMTTVTIKVLPAPEKTRTVLVFGLDDESAIQALSDVLQGPFEANSAAHLPADIAAKSSVSYVASSGRSVTAIRLQGPAPSVEVRCQGVRALWQDRGEVEELHGHNSASLWQEIRDVSPLLNNPGDQIWRLSVPPADGAKLVEGLKSQFECDAYFDWGGGLIWLAAASGLEQVGALARDAIAMPGGHATLLRASPERRLLNDVFQPQSAELRRLSKTLKDNFDPDGVLNPGRMYEGI